MTLFDLRDISIGC